MATFIVIPQDDTVSEKLAEIIARKFGNRSYALPRGEWLVSYEGTTRQLFEALEIDNMLVVLNFYGYWGSARPDLWEWVSAYQK
jgi:hypothetical protein